MPYHRSYKIGPTKTPLIIKIILSLIICVSILNALIAPFFEANYFGYLFGLSIHGIKNFFIWQLITYSFLQPGYGISISFILPLLFNMYLIWVIGTAVIERISQIQFFIFYLFSVIFSGIIILLIMSLGYPNYIFAGPVIPLYAILISWMMLNPADTKIFLFFTIPLKLYWLVMGLIGFNLLSALSNMQMVNFFGYLSVSIFSYFYSVIIWHRYSPFHFLNKMERMLIYTFKPIINKFKRKKHH